VRRTGILAWPVTERLYVGSYFFYKRHLEDPFFHLAKRYPGLFQRGHVLDIGANIGYTSLVFARVVQEGYSVYAFEPEQDNFSLLERNLRRSRWGKRIKPIHSAVGDRDGVSEIWINEDHRGDHRILTENFRKGLESPTQSVPLVTVDRFVDALDRESRDASARVSFVKIDVQGYEPAVCRGMRRFLESQRDASVAVEYDPELIRELGFLPREMLQAFTDVDYFAYRIGPRGNLSPCKLDSIDYHLGPKGYADLLFTRMELQAGT
jgi:FkbM family methyltransferase